MKAGRREGGGISSAIQADRRRSRNLLHSQTGLIQPPQFSMSPEHDDTMLANVRPTSSGAQEKQPHEQSPSQTNTGLHRGSPQTSTHFSVPALGFFFFSSLPQTHTNTHTHTHTHTYIRRSRRKKMYTPQNIPRNRAFLPFCLTSVVFLMNFFSLSSPPERSLPACFVAPVRVSCTGGGQTG